MSIIVWARCCTSKHPGNLAPDTGAGFQCSSALFGQGMVVEVARVNVDRKRYGDDAGLGSVAAKEVLLDFAAKGADSGDDAFGHIAKRSRGDNLVTCASFRCRVHV